MLRAVERLDAEDRDDDLRAARRKSPRRGRARRRARSRRRRRRRCAPARRNGGEYSYHLGGASTGRSIAATTCGWRRAVREASARVNQAPVEAVFAREPRRRTRGTVGALRIGDRRRWRAAAAPPRRGAATRQVRRQGDVKAWRRGRAGNPRAVGDGADGIIAPSPPQSPSRPASARVCPAPIPMLYHAFRPAALRARSGERARTRVRQPRPRRARLASRSGCCRRSRASPVTRDGARCSRTASASPPGSTRTPSTSTAWPRSASATSSAGTVTPRPQPGNPKPRHVPAGRGRGASSTGWASTTAGVERFLANVGRARWHRGILGLNIGKNFDTPNERAVDDYLACLRAVYARAAYVAVNISSPNTKGLRDLQAEDALRRAAGRAEGGADRRSPTGTASTRRWPSRSRPTSTPAAIEGIARLLVATPRSTASSRPTRRSRATPFAVRRTPRKPGGLSGAPAAGARRPRSCAALAKALDGALPIIGVGGILSGADAKREDRRRRDAGPDLHRPRLPRPGARRRVRARARPRGT